MYYAHTGYFFPTVEQLRPHVVSPAPPPTVPPPPAAAPAAGINPASTTVLAASAGAGAYAGYKAGGAMFGVLGAIAALGVAVRLGFSKKAGDWWTSRHQSAQPTAQTKGCSCGRPKPEIERASVGRSPYSLHHANASRFKAIAELALLEDHMINDPCPDCMNKHAMTASRLMSEAATLDEGEAGDVVGAELIEDIRQALKPESDIPLANRSRDIRKKIQQKLKLSHVDHAHED